MVADKLFLAVEETSLLHLLCVFFPWQEPVVLAVNSRIFLGTTAEGAAKRRLRRWKTKREIG